jgi:hypothetical protein
MSDKLTIANNKLHIVSSGCSFTADGIGGLPPSRSHLTGGCSFVHGDQIPKSWTGMLAKKMQCNSLVNFASPSHGNILVSMTIIEALTKYPAYRPTNTLVLFNLSDPGRLDIACSHTHTDKSNCTSWSEEILPFSFLLPQSKLHNLMSKNIGIEQVEIMSQHAVIALLNFLFSKKFNYRFLMMTDYLNHGILASVLKNYQHNLVTLPDSNSIAEYCIANNLTISDNDRHPSQEGHKIIADLVYNTL